MAGSLDALKKYVFGKKEAKDVELPLTPGNKPDPRLPKQQSSGSIRKGFEAARQATQRKKDR